MPQQQSSTAPVVLIVENDVLLRLVTASNLRDAGFEVLEAANSAEAIRIPARSTVLHWRNGCIGARLIRELY
jgi:CheY-like chemotaxis protein